MYLYLYPMGREIAIHLLMRILVGVLMPTTFSDVRVVAELNFLSNVIDDDYCKHTSQKVSTPDFYSPVHEDPDDILHNNIYPELHSHS